ncbi:MAG: hypothetical protein ACXACY_30305 [Candidatus Hodarchaeales archaeon]
MVESDIFAFCLRRSGHTAIMNWIAAQLQPSHSLKDCNMRGDNLCTPVVHVIDNDELKYEIYRDGFGLRYLSKEQRWQYLHKYKLTLCSFEDSAHIERDPFNLFASRVWRNKHNPNEIPFNDRAADWYNMQLKQWYSNRSFTFISYYDWVTSRKYRRQITKELNIPFSDKFYNRQANISSFNNFDYKVVKNGFNHRWEEFLSIANDAQKKEYSHLLSKIDFELVNEFFLDLDCDEILSIVGQI